MKCGVFLLSISLFGCASIETVEKPYAPVPDTCEALQIEMDRVAARIAKTQNIRSIKTVGVAAIPFAVAFGAIPPAFAVAIPIINMAHLPEPRQRLDYLAQAKLHMGCGVVHGSR